MQEERFLEILSGALLQPEIKYNEILSYDEWNDIYKEAVSHSIAPILYSVIYENSSVPEVLKEIWKSTALITQMKWLHMMGAQSQILNLLNQNKIDVAVIKGVAAAMYYPNPFQRLSGDVDLIVKKADYDRAYNLLLENGYAPEGELSYHREVSKDGIVFELHHTIPKLPERKQGRKTYKLISESIAYYETVSVTNFTVQVLPPLQNGIVLLRHILQHMIKGIGLRQIIDWMMYVDKNLDDSKWDDAKTEYDRCGLTNTAIIITKMCQRYLGLRTEGITWCSNGEDEVGDALIKYVLAKGNFGRKDRSNQSEKGITVFTRDKGIVNFFRRLQNHGIANWTACHNHPILKPFAWFHTIIRYTNYVVKRENATHQLIEDFDVGIERNRMFKCVGCFDSKIFDQKDITR